MRVNDFCWNVDIRVLSQWVWESPLRHQHLVIAANCDVTRFRYSKHCEHFISTRIFARKTSDSKHLLLLSNSFQTSGKDPLMPPWRIDPCQLEARGFSRESVRLMQGRLRVSWTPNHHSPKFKLVITAFAKGFHCKQAQHPCLKYGYDLSMDSSKKWSK